MRYSNVEFLEMAAAGDVSGVKNYLANHVSANTKDAKNSNKTALMAAVAGDHIEVVELLIKYGADLELRDKNGNTALAYAVVYGCVNAARVLLDKDANSNTADGDGWTALMGAAIEGEKEMVELLLAHGANPYAEDTCGGTAYQYAKSMGHLEVIRLLPDPNAVNETVDRGREALGRLQRGIEKRKVVRS